MAFKELILVGFLATFVCWATATNKHKIVTYWGQNAVYNSKKQKQFWEKDLTEFCRNYNYDVIVLSFLNVFFDHANKDDMPGLNFAFHCETGVSPEYPKLYRCPKIGNAIKECQRNGKRVLMSLGGAVGQYGFTSPAQAKKFAYRVYHLLLAGTDLQAIRPFGNAVLNGVDLDIEGGSFQFYDDFVRELRNLEKTGHQKITIAAAPQCPFPDRLLGPSKDHVLGEVPELVDEIYVQFYNNWCNAGNERVFYDHVKKWLTCCKGDKRPLIYVGLPGNTRASGTSSHYRPPSELRKIYQRLKDEPRFGGFMFWDASFDQNNIINGKHFSEHIADMYKEHIKGTGQPFTLTGFTGKTFTTASTGTSPNTVATKPVKPTTTSCVGIPDGIYAHPADCSKFFECNSGVSFVKSCGAGLKFNPIQKICDWPQNVNC